MTLYDWLCSVFQGQPALAVTSIISGLALTILAFTTLGWRIMDGRHRKKIEEEDNKLSWNWRPQCPKWIYWIWLKLRVARNWLIILTAVLAFSAVLQTCSLYYQEIAVKNNPANQPRINCSSSINSDGFINVVMVNVGAPFKAEPSNPSVTCWVKVKVSHKEMLDPLPINYSLKDEVTSEEDETRWERSFTVANPLNFSQILKKDASKKIRIIPFVVIRVSYKDMFGKPYRAYYRIEGEQYPRSTWNSGWDDTGWGNTGWNDGGWGNTGWNDGGWGNTGWNDGGWDTVYVVYLPLCFLALYIWLILVTP